MGQNTSPRGLWPPHDSTTQAGLTSNWLLYDNQFLRRRLWDLNCYKTWAQDASKEAGTPSAPQTLRSSRAALGLMGCLMCLSAAKRICSSTVWCGTNNYDITLKVISFSDVRGTKHLRGIANIYPSIESFTGGSAVKKSSEGVAGAAHLIPGLGRSPGGGHGNPLQYSCLENPMDREAWWVQSIGLQRVRYNWSSLAHVRARAHTHTHTHIHTHTHNLP